MYFDEYEVGMVFDDIEPISFTEEEIIEAGKRYDPRPIHVDKKAAEKSRFGRIIASGSWANTVFWGQWVKTRIDEEGMICGVRVDNASWLLPIYPDTFYTIKVETTKLLERKAGQDGFVTNKLTAYDPEGEVVLIYEATALVEFKK